MTALVLELCGGVCALSTIIFLAMLMVRKLEEELGPDLARSQAESFVAHLEQSGFFILRRPIPKHGAGDNSVWRGFEG